jgi:signal transduction histidine kinase
MEETSHINFISLLLPLALTVFVISIGVILLNQHFQKNVFRQKLEKETLKTKTQQDLLQSVIQTQEEERKRIAGDLHDELGAVLSMARMHLVQAENITQDAAALTYLKNARTMTEAALENMRRITHELMPPILEKFGLLKTLEELTRQLPERNDLEIDLIAPQELPRIPVSSEINLYRVIMEMVNNTIKHASANRIVVQFDYHPGWITIDYTDNGRGFTPHLYTARTGSGMKNIEARVNALKGILKLSNSASGGMHASIKMPLVVA